MNPVQGSATSIISNPIWVVQAQQITAPSDASRPTKRSIIETVEHILRKDGVSAFWRGIGVRVVISPRSITRTSSIQPALVLVINPVLQYTVFEQLKNLLVKRRTTALRAAGQAAVVATLSDWDFFVLGALSKLG
jgi:solute carrier family 25 (peroxisomal adenine nucleotide transporter), member 17